MCHPQCQEILSHESQCWKFYGIHENLQNEFKKVSYFIYGLSSWRFNSKLWYLVLVIWKITWIVLAKKWCFDIAINWLPSIFKVLFRKMTLSIPILSDSFLPKTVTNRVSYTFPVSLFFKYLSRRCVCFIVRFMSYIRPESSKLLR